MWGLIVGGIVALVAVGLLVEGILSAKYFLAMLVIAVVAGLSVAGLTKKFTATWKGVEWETFEEQADAIKQQALDEIKAEVAKQRKLLSDVVTEANETREALEKVAEAAAPPLLSLASKPDIKKTGQGGYQVLLQFEPSKNSPFGTVAFSADIVEGGTAIIEQLQTKMLCFQKESTKSDDGKRAKTQYVPAKPEGQTLVLNVSAPCRIRITCNYMKEPLDLEIK